METYDVDGDKDVGINDDDDDDDDDDGGSPAGVVIKITLMRNEIV